MEKKDTNGSVNTKKIAIVAVAAVAAIIIAVGLRRPGKTSVQETTTTVVETTLSEEERKLSDYKTYGMQKDPIPGIVDLVKSYQYAKLNGDSTRMYNVFGRSDTEGIQEMYDKLQEDRKVYESFDDTVTYVTKGVEDNSYVVFISTNVKFYDIETKAPMLTWVYVKEQPKGAFYMVENDKLTDEEKKFVEDVSRSEDIIALDGQMRKDLATAVTSDLQLGTLYSIWVQNAATDESTSQSSSAQESEKDTTEESTVEGINDRSSEAADVSIGSSSDN